MKKFSFDLTVPEHAYAFGFIQADGHLYKQSRNRGKLTIEIKSSDEWILKKISELFPCNNSITRRERNTNFIKGFKATCLSICSKFIRDELNSLGLPYGKKSDIIKPPAEPYSKIDYFRGLIDGDGSLGMTAKGFPFLSLTAKSDEIANAYMDFIFESVGKKKSVNKNKRDQIYNICLYREEATQLINILYYDKCIALPRKKKKAVKIKSWVRPLSMSKKITFKRVYWSKEEDQYITSHTIDESINFLKRTFKSIKIRLWRLENNTIKTYKAIRHSKIY